MSLEKLTSSDWKQYLNLRSELGGYKYTINKKMFEDKYTSIKNQNGYIYVVKVGGEIVGTGKIFIEINILQQNYKITIVIL